MEGGICRTRRLWYLNYTQGWNPCPLGRIYYSQFSLPAGAQILKLHKQCYASPQILTIPTSSEAVTIQVTKF